MTAGQGKFGGRKIREGTVVSDKMEKTIVVSVASAIRHRLYKKIIRRQRHYMAHDENGEAHVGDRVRIVEAAPISKTKRWRLAEVLTQVDLPDLAPEDIDLEIIGEVKPEAEEAAEAEAPAVAAEPEAPAVEPEPAPGDEPLAESETPEAEDVVQADAGAEALETPEQTHAEAEPAEPETEPITEEEPVQQDAAPEATEPTDAPIAEEAAEGEEEKPE
jgi:small subunit ribosomal protein S17